jgi:lysophospholipase L1-like esterase
MSIDLHALHRRWPLALAACAALWMPHVSHARTQAASAAQAPTPYPARAQDWPGRGVIRVFDWMTENRRYFWRERERKQGGIVFAGDSLTASWRGLDAEFPQQRIANRGIGGDVSRGLLFRFEEDVLALQPKAIVLLIGTNDLTARQPASDTLANLEAMLDLRDRHVPGTHIVLCTVPPSANPQAPIDPHQLTVLNAGVRELAARRDGVSVVDLFAATATASGTPDLQWFKPDRLHLSEAGYERWKAALVPVLREHGLL